MAAHFCSTSIQEAEAGELLHGPRGSGSHSETLPQTIRGQGSFLLVSSRNFSVLLHLCVTPEEGNCSLTEPHSLPCGCVTPGDGTRASLLSRQHLLLSMRTARSVPSGEHVFHEHPAAGQAEALI